MSAVIQQEQDVLLTEKQAAEMLGVRPQTLNAWRSKKSSGPPFIKISRRCVRYSKRAVQVYLDQNTVQPSAA